MSKLPEVPDNRLPRLTTAATAGEPANVTTAPACAAPRFCNDLIAATVMSVLSGLTMAFKPSPWVHGRIHSWGERRIGRTPVQSNPYHYRDVNPGCNPGLVAEIRS